MFNDDGRLKDIRDRWNLQTPPSVQSRVWRTFPRNPTQDELFDQAKEDIDYLLAALRGGAASGPTEEPE